MSSNNSNTEHQKLEIKSKMMDITSCFINFFLMIIFGSSACMGAAFLYLIIKYVVEH